MGGREARELCLGVGLRGDRIWLALDTQCQKFSCDPVDWKPSGWMSEAQAQGSLAP